MTPEELQRRVQDTVDERIDFRTELGVQVAVIHGGRLVVNVASGLADVSGRVVEPDTLLWAASTAKGVASLGVVDDIHFGVPDRLLPSVAQQVAHAGQCRIHPNPVPPRPGRSRPRSHPLPTWPTVPTFCGRTFRRPGR